MTSYDPNQQQPEQPNPYGQPAQAVPQNGYMQAAPYMNTGTEKNNLGGWSLGLGIAAIICCGLFTGIPALITGYLSLQAVKEGKASNKTMAIIGIVLGALGTVVSIVWTIYAVQNGTYEMTSY